jgi:hypothetical protein
MTKIKESSNEKEFKARCQTKSRCKESNEKEKVTAVAAQGTVDHFTYCTKVCGAKCCVLHLPDEGAVPCPRLTKDKACSVYRKRFAPEMPDLVVVGRFKSRVYQDLEGKPAVRPFWCGRIEKLLAQGQVPKEIADQCCYANPGVLNDAMENRPSEGQDDRSAGAGRDRAGDTNCPDRGEPEG